MVSLVSSPSGCSCSHGRPPPPLRPRFPLSRRTLASFPLGLYRLQCLAGIAYLASTCGTIGRLRLTLASVDPGTRLVSRPAVMLCQAPFSSAAWCGMVPLSDVMPRHLKAGMLKFRKWLCFDTY